MILSSLKIMIIFNNTSADFVLMSAYAILKIGVRDYLTDLYDRNSGMELRNKIIALHTNENFWSEFRIEKQSASPHNIYSVVEFFSTLGCVKEAKLERLIHLITSIYV